MTNKEFQDVNTFAYIKRKNNVVKSSYKIHKFNINHYTKSIKMTKLQHKIKTRYKTLKKEKNMKMKIQNIFPAIHFQIENKHKL